jgi:hypothetical protein
MMGCFGAGKRIHCWFVIVYGKDDGVLTHIALRQKAACLYCIAIMGLGSG